jgi:hypothetical protein
MKIIVRLVVIIVLLLAGFAAGIPVGRSIGFNTGSEWALVQADILAREAGVSMPVYFKEGQLRVIVKQPRGIYKRAWELSDRYYEEMENVEKGTRTLSETVSLAQSSYPTQ